LDGISALVAKVDGIPVVGAAFVAHDRRLRGERICRDRGAARFTGTSEMMQAFQVAAFAFPVSDGVADEFECRDATKIRYWKNGLENRLQPCVVAFLGQHVHLEEPLVGILLYLDEIGDLDRRPDLRKIDSVSGGSVLGFRHCVGMLLNDNKPTCGRTTPSGQLR
jgi:hypothetical protein